MSCTGACHEHINFTTRGKFLLMDVEKAKRDEFNRRRKLRLQQVRQQSREIAKEIRDRVKAEKMLKDSQEDLRKKAQFDRWKEVQLKNLKDEFCRRAIVAEQEKENALKEVELAELEKERQQVLDEISKKRGNLAMLKQRKEKLNVETESFLKSNNAKFNRSIENLRSALIASLPKTDSKHISAEQEICFQDRQVGSNVVYQHAEIDSAKNSEFSLDEHSVMKIISSGEQSARRAPTSNLGGDKLSHGIHDLYDMDSYSTRQPLSKITSPGKRSFAECEVSPRKSDSAETLAFKKSSCFQQAQSSYRSGHSLDPRKEISPTRDSRTFARQSVPNHPYQSSSGSSYQCNHSKDQSPVRCDEFYSPNRYKDGVDNIGTINLKSKKVRFENVSLTDESEQFQPSIRHNRTSSEGDSESSFESVATWPPRKWNHQQEEDVILYDHCRRTTSRYQPSHTVSLISSEPGTERLEEEVEACRRKALRKHEEAVRERRGCRAMYRQQLRAEFSCMLSDLANLDKQSRLAKLESDAKNALLPKKLKKGPKGICKNENPEKDDSPGRVHVMDCIDPLHVDIDKKKVGEEMKENELTHYNLEALDMLLVGLKEQRDYLLACQQSNDEEIDKIVHSVSVQCDELPKADHATSPRETSPERSVHHHEESSTDKVKSRSVTPTYPSQQSKHHSHSSTSGASASYASPLVSDDSPGHHGSFDLSPKCFKDFKAKKNKESVDVSTPSKEMDPSSNKPKEVSPIVSNGSSSTMSVDTTSYSFDGVKVEVKVTKNKTRKMEKRIGIKADPTKKYKDNFIKTIEETKDDSWVRKLSENNSSGGTSYMSPPDELNPDEHKLLISVLETMEKKNSNPVLHMYIKRLLSMSKGSLENMSISLSDDSRSDVFKSCEESCRDSSRPRDTSRSFMSALSQAETTDKENGDVSNSVVEKVVQDRVRIILDSDDGFANKDTSMAYSTNKEVCDAGVSPQVPAVTTSSPPYLNTLSHYNNRLRFLAKMITQKADSSKTCYSENETAYLQIPSDLEESLRVPVTAQEVSLPHSEESVLADYKEANSSEPADSALTSSFGLGLNLLPKPDSLNDRIHNKKQKPPSTLNNHGPRRVLTQSSVVPHELSAISEVDSKLISMHPSIKPSHSETLGPSPSNVDMPGTSTLENLRSESESYHTMLPVGLAVSSDSSFISSSSVSPVKPANESSLQIFTDLPNSSLGASSVEEMAVSEVFRSLGIGWAVSTWRKTHEASRKHHESSSSSNPSDPGTKKRKEDKCRHSTPIKMSEAERNRKILESEEDRLTPPSVSLYQRYQNLICSNTDSSHSGDS